MQRRTTGGARQQLQPSPLVIVQRRVESCLWCVYRDERRVGASVHLAIQVCLKALAREWKW